MPVINYHENVVISCPIKQLPFCIVIIVIMEKCYVIIVIHPAN